MELLRLVAVSAVLLPSVSLMAQQSTAGETPTSAGTLSIQTKLVAVPTVVRDKKGALVPNLTKADFTLQVDGKPQVIRYFDHDTNVPLTLGLLIDTSQSQRSVLDSERTASSSFLDKMLTPATSSRAADKAFIVQFARSVELLQDVTDSRPKLQQALKEVDTTAPGSPSFQPSTNDDDRDRSSSRGGGTALYDSVFLSSDEIAGKQKGRRALILLTDGVDRNSKETLAASIEAAQRADTVLYAIYFKGEEDHHQNGGYPGGGHRGGMGGGFPFPGGGGGGQGGGQGGGRGPGGNTRSQVDGKKILERMCGETGGRVFELTKKQTLDDIFGQIAEELRSQYRLDFTPATEAAADGYHRIDLALTGAQAKNKLTIQTRDGYYTGK